MKKSRIQKLIATSLAILVTVSLTPSHFIESYATEHILATNTRPETGIKIVDSLDLLEGRDFDLTESYAYDQPELSKLEVTAGKLTGDINNSYSNLEISLSAETPGFQIVGTPIATGGTTPKITIDGTEVPAGVASQMIYLDKGQCKDIQIVSQGKNEGDGYGDETKVYTLKAYRTKTTATLDTGAFIEKGGAKQLAVTFKIGAADTSALLQTLNLAISYDPTKIKPSHKDTNVIVTSTGTIPSTIITYNSRLSTFFMPVKRTIDTTKGSIIIHLGKDTSKTAPYYTVPAGGETLITLYFRVLDDNAAFDENTIKMLTDKDNKVANLDPPTGLAFMEKIQGTETFFSSQAPGITTFKGQEFKLTKSTRQPVNGSMSISQDKEVYYYGEEVKVFAIPKTGYVFSNWSIDSTQSANLHSTTENPAKVRMYQDKDISTLVPIFVKSDVVSDSNSRIDFGLPLTGEIVLMLNEPYTRPQFNLLEGMSVEHTELESLQEEETVKEMDTTIIDGKTASQLSYEEELLPSYYEPAKGQDSLDSFSENQVSYEVGDQRNLKTRNLSGTGDIWVEKPFTLICAGNKTNVWLNDGDELGGRLTQTQKDEMLASFENSYEVINTKYTPIYDRNQNGKLDILVYDIQDGYNGTTKNSYYAGLFSANELYTGAEYPQSGNAMDTIHLDTYPSMKDGDALNPIITRVVSTMAHETQHLAFSSFFNDSENPIQMLIDGAKPTWIDEGLSMSVEDELFGVLTSRIAKYNSSDNIKNGSISLLNWQSTLENYSLSYLFFQYLKEQSIGAGVDDGYMRSFYKSYAQDEEAALMSVVGRIPHFANKNMTDVLQAFYIAKLLKDQTGMYGFNGNPDFNQISTRTLNTEPSSLPMGSAVYITNPGEFFPNKGLPYIFAGIDPAPIVYYTLTVENTTGGSIQIQGEKENYIAGERITVTANPDSGYEFKGFTGALTGTTNPQTFTINENTSISAIFEKLPPKIYTLTVENTTGGSIQIQGEKENYLEGDTVTISAVEDTGFRFKNFTGALTGNTNPQTLTINENVSVSAIFDKLEFVEPAQIRNILQAPNGSLETSSFATDGAVVLKIEGKGTIRLRTKDGAPLSSNTQIEKGTAMILSADVEKGKVLKHWVRVPANIEGGSLHNFSLENTTELIESYDSQDPENLFYGNPLEIQIDADYLYYPVIEMAEGTVYLGGMEILEPLGRKIIAKSIDEGLELNLGAANGFISGETDYNVHLLCRDAITVTEGAITKKKTFITLNLNFYEDKETATVTSIGKDGVTQIPAIVTYTVHDGGGNILTDKTARTATATVDVTNASRIEIKVNGDALGKEENTYNIYVNQHASVEDDPTLKVKLEKDTEVENLGKYILKASLQNTTFFSAQATIKVTKGALELDGHAIKSEGLKLDHIAKLTEADVLGDSETDKYDFNSYDYFTFTVAPTDEILLSQGAIKVQGEIQVIEIYMKNAESFTGSLDLLSDWDKAEAGNKIFDQSHIDVYGSTKVIKGDGVNIKGQFKAYNKNVGMEALAKLYLGSKEDVAAKEATVTLVSENQDSAGRYTYNFEFEEVLPAEYLLVITKPSHAKYKVQGIEVGLENIDLTTTLPAVANPELSNINLLCGDLDGDNTVNLMDRDLLMSTKYYGYKVLEFPETIESGDLTERYKAQINDLDGDGYIKLSDLNILMSPANYGKGAVTIDYLKN